MKKTLITFSFIISLFTILNSSVPFTKMTIKDTDTLTLNTPKKKNIASNDDNSSYCNDDMINFEFNEYNVLTDKYNSLQEMLVSYEEGTTEFENLTRLCNITNRFINQCDQNKITSWDEIITLSRNTTPSTTRTINDPIVLGALSYFALNKYDLSYELLAHAFDDYVEQEPDYYVPVHGYRVFQSDLTYLIENDSSNSSADFIINNPGLFGDFIFEDTNDHSLYVAYPKTGNSYEKDLYYSIHGFSFQKVNNVVTIMDLYDFAANKYDGLEGYVINYLHDLQENNILKKYDLIITYDTSHFLRLKTISLSNSVWTIEVKNPNSVAVDFIYNKKMCNFDDAKNWTNLVDVSYGTVAGNSTSIVTISENMFATSVSFSFFNNSIKYMIYGDGLADNGMIDFRINQKTQTFNNKIRLMGKDGTRWLVKLKNTTSYHALIEYNTKMCFYSDAQNWTGLLDLVDFYLQPGETRFIYISENGTATSIAVTFSGQTLNCSYYADNLNINGTMSLHSASRSSRIRIENRGKSGTKWNIRVKNPTNHSITVYYNCKMCFENDAKNWTALGNNERSVVIGSHQSADIQISENWFATHITTSYVSNGYRIITYADGLNSNTYNMNIYHNVVAN